MTSYEPTPLFKKDIDTRVKFLNKVLRDVSKKNVTERNCGLLPLYSRRSRKILHSIHILFANAWSRFH